MGFVEHFTRTDVHAVFQDAWSAGIVEIAELCQRRWEERGIQRLVRRVHNGGFVVSRTPILVDLIKLQP